MWCDVIDLRDFYACPLGHTARRMIRRRIREMWADTRGLSVLGLGYATPYLGVFREDAARVVAVMPAPLGVLAWPGDGRNLTALAEEGELPLADRSVDRVLLVHALESTDNMRAMMREIWRVLTDGGRLLVVVTNRRGIWSVLERTPFGQGRPYTVTQLNRLLRDNLFLPLQSGAALYMPPSQRRMVLRSAPAWEKLGARWFPGLAGVLLAEASKQIYAASAVRTIQRRRRYVALPQGARQGRDAVLKIPGVKEPR